MMRKLGISLLCASGLWATSAFSTTEHLFSQGLAIEYELPANDPQIFSNIFFWTIKANCTIISESAENLISVKMLRKTGSVNSQQLTSGDTLEITVQAGDKLSISADSGAKVELVNLGHKTIVASCSTA